MAFTVPSQYEALDDATFAKNRAYDAHTLKSIQRAHNRLVGASSQMFSMAWPKRTFTVGASTTYNSYQVYVDSRWTLMVPPFVVKKKPGFNRATFRIGYGSNNGGRLQVCTLARPFVATPGGNDPGFIAGATGSDIVRGLEGIPVDPGPYELIEVWVAGVDGGITATDFLGTSAASGEIIQAGQGRLTLQATGGGDLDWNVTGGTATGDFGAFGFWINVFYPSGELVGRWRIESVTEVISDPASGGVLNGTFRSVYVARDNLPSVLRTQINLAPQTTDGPFTFTITESTKMHMNFLAAAVEDRTR